MNKNGKKNFKGWMKIKEKIHYTGTIRSIKEGEVWWGSIGENVGVEICGKGKTYTRPVIILKKLNKYSFWAIPLTSKQHKGDWYVSFELHNTKEIAVLSQIQSISVFRFHRKIGQLSRADFELVYKSFIKLVKKRK